MIKRPPSILKPMAGCQIDRTHPINKGLVGYWMFNEKSGTRLTDYSGYGNHGTLTNFALNGATSNWVGSPTGGSINFLQSARNNYVDISRLSIGSVFTFSAWIYPIGTGVRTILGNRTSTNYGNPQWRVETSADNRMYLVKQGVVGIGLSTGTVTNNKWNHVALSYSAAGEYKHYINGTLSGSGTNLVALVSGGLPAIGVRFSTSISDEQFDGNIDLLKIYNVVKTPLEISQLYTNPNIGLLTPTYYTQS